MDRILERIARRKADKNVWLTAILFFSIQSFSIIWWASKITTELTYMREQLQDQKTARQAEDALRYSQLDAQRDFMVRDKAIDDLRRMIIENGRRR